MKPDPTEPDDITLFLVPPRGEEVGCGESHGRFFSCMIRMLRLSAAMLISLLSARAHDPGPSTVQVAVGGDAVEVAVTFSNADLLALRPPSPVTGEWIADLIEPGVSGQLLTPRSTDTIPTRRRAAIHRHVSASGCGRRSRATGTALCFVAAGAPPIRAGS